MVLSGIYGETIHSCHYIGSVGHTRYNLSYTLTMNISRLCKDELRSSLAAAVVPLFTLLKDPRPNVRIAATNTISKLVLHGKLNRYNG